MIMKEVVHMTPLNEEIQRFVEEMVDLSENAEYDAAKAEQAENAEFIRVCEEKIKHAKVVDDDNIDKSTVNIGLIVKVLDMDFDEEFTYEITGTTGADPLNGKISVDSPVAKAETAKVHTASAAMITARSMETVFFISEYHPF